MAPNSGNETIKKVETPPQTAILNKDEERLRALAVIRERLAEGRLKVEGNPNKAYYWANTIDEAERYRLDLLGFSICKDPKVKAQGKKEDGTFVIGDVILMEIDRDLYEALKQEKVDRAYEQAGFKTAKKAFESEAAKMGVPTFETQPERS